MTSRFLILFLPFIAAAAPGPFDDLFFEPNLGQSPSPVKYFARTPGASLAFEAEGVRIESGGAGVVLRFPGASLPARFEPLDPTLDRSFYFIGSDQSRWTRDVPHYRRLAWRGIYPGVDAVFYGAGGRLEYDLLIAPGADAGRVRVRFQGARRVSIAESGALLVRSGALAFEMLRPRVFQHAAAGDTAVEARYRRTAAAEVRFDLADYDRARELVVDPVLQFVNYYGGERDDSVIAVTTTGDVVGVTSSSGIGDGRLRSGKDVFAYMPLSNGSTLMVIGGTDDDAPTCAVGDNANLIIGGWTRSKDFLGHSSHGGMDGFLV
jgi:hypothetical protein